MEIASYIGIVVAVLAAGLWIEWSTGGGPPTFGA